MKKLSYLLIGICLAAALPVYGQSSSLWKIVGNKIMPVVDSWLVTSKRGFSGATLTITRNKNCSALETTASGAVVCGTDDAGGAPVNFGTGNVLTINQQTDNATGTGHLSKRLQSVFLASSTGSLKTNFSAQFLHSSTGAVANAFKSIFLASSTGSLQTYLDTLFLKNAEADTEAELETLLTDVSNVFTNNDGALADDNLSNNTTSDLAEGSNLYYTTTRADGRYVNTSGDTMTGALTITGAALNVSGLASTNRNLTLQSGGLTRWTVRLNTSQNLALVRHNGAGTALDSPFLVDATTGFVQIGAVAKAPSVQLEVNGAMSGSSLTVSGLKNCTNTATTIAGVFACNNALYLATSTGSLETYLNTLYANVSGDTFTGTVEFAGLGSGKVLHATDLLRSSGALAIEGGFYQDGLADCDNAGEKPVYNFATGKWTCGTDDDVPESGDFGAGGDLEADGTITDGVIDKADLSVSTDFGGISTDGSSNLTVDDNTLVEPDLSADNAPNDADILTYDSTGTNFNWITPNAGTDVTADLEEEVTAGSLANDTILEADLKVVDAPSDEDIMTYETTTGDFEWHTCAQITGSADLCDGNDATGAGGGGGRISGTGASTQVAFFNSPTNLSGSSMFTWVHASKLLDIAGTASGRILHAQDQLRSSGSLAVEGSVRVNNTGFVYNAATGIAAIGSEPDPLYGLTVASGYLGVTGGGLEVLGGYGYFAEDLEVIGTASGRRLHAQNRLTSSGAFALDGGFWQDGLADADAATQKVLYDLTTGKFTSATDDDVPESGDFAAGVDLDADGSLSDASIDTKNKFLGDTDFGEIITDVNSNIFIDANVIGQNEVSDDALDFDELQDGLDVDAATTITLGSNDLDINATSTGQFEVLGTASGRRLHAQDSMTSSGTFVTTAGDTNYGLGQKPSLVLGKSGVGGGVVKMWGGTAGQYGLFRVSDQNFHIDITGGDTYLNYDDGNNVYFGGGNGSIVGVWQGGGNVGMGRNPPKTKLEVGGTMSGSALTVTGLKSCAGLLTNSAGVTACTSDANLKVLHGTFSKGLESILGITPQTYSWKEGTRMYDGGTPYSGFIAQDVEKALPEAVNRGEGGVAPGVAGDHPGGPRERGEGPLRPLPEPRQAIHRVREEPLGPRSWCWTLELLESPQGAGLLQRPLRPRRHL